MTLRKQLLKVQSSKSALLATNFYNFETLKGIVIAASELNFPIILQTTKSSIEYMGLKTTVQLARTMIQEHNVQAWLHLDHCHSIELIKACLDAGYDSVMIDASEAPMKENIAITSDVVRMAKAYGAIVEAELGYVAKLGQDSTKKGFTEPEDAKLFVEDTGVDALAVAIGSAHGFYKEPPELDLDRLQNIAHSTNAFLVLHGGSGIPADAIRSAVRRGICKVNLATEIKNAFMQRIASELRSTKEIDLRIVFPPAISDVTNLVKEKLNLFL